MADETLLADDFVRQLINVGEVDILIGLPTHNNAKTIQPVIRAIQAGILKYFPRERAVVINPDGGSHDGTTELVTGVSIDDMWSVSKVYALRTLHAVSVEYARVPEPGIALRTILAAADLLRAKVSVVISPDAIAIEPDWLQRLVRPVYFDNFDLVSPVYQRQKSEGVLMRNVLYPVTRAIYGRSIREPYASDFAVSSRLAADFLAKESWNEEWGREGAEICLAIAAITGKYRLCQTFLGVKTQPHRSPSDVVLAMRRTVGALFASLDSNFPFWSAVATAEAVPTLEGQSKEVLEPARINRKRLWEMFSHGVSELEPVFKSILSPATLAQLQGIAALEMTAFNYPPEFWAKTVFEFAASYHKSVINRDHIIQALVPLFRGRALTFLLQNRDASDDEVERHVESLCAAFEQQKPYLLEVWNGGK